MKEWFESWFDTKYYHILYKNRDYSEAEYFIKNLFSMLEMPADTRVLDLACGKGRHSIFVNSLGFDTTGVDLSEQSIETAKKSENENLHFFQHDMREVIPAKKFDLVLNLFTSFGYFNDKRENEKVIESIYSYLSDNGKLVIDFFNAKKVVADMVAEEIKEIEGITFKISKAVENGCVVKRIVFEDNGQNFSFQEKVQLLELEDFEYFLKKAGFTVEGIYGDYHLQELSDNSDRLIIIAKKVIE